MYEKTVIKDKSLSFTAIWYQFTIAEKYYKFVIARFYATNSFQVILGLISKVRFHGLVPKLAPLYVRFELDVELIKLFLF